MTHDSLVATVDNIINRADVKSVWLLPAQLVPTTVLGNVIRFVLITEENVLERAGKGVIGVFLAIDDATEQVRLVKSEESTFVGADAGENQNQIVDVQRTVDNVGTYDFVGETATIRQDVAKEDVTATRIAKDAVKTGALAEEILVYLESLTDAKSYNLCIPFVVWNKLLYYWNVNFQFIDKLLYVFVRIL